MGTYNVWVGGQDVFALIEPYDEGNNIPAAFPGLTYDYFGGIEEPGPAYHLVLLSEEEYPFALIMSTGQIAREALPGSEPDPSVSVGVDQMRAYLYGHPQETVTPMQWHS